MQTLKRIAGLPKWLLLLLVLLSGASVLVGLAVVVQYLVPTRALAL